MKALFALARANFQKSLYIAAFMPIIVWAYPAWYVHASDSNTALVFEVKPNQNLSLGSTQIKTSITIEDVLNAQAEDPLVDRLVAYLEAKKSPLANRDTVVHILQYTAETGGTAVWKRALAISFVESHMCRFTPKRGWNSETKKFIAKESHNCSGIMVGKGYRGYNSYAAWFTDMTNLLLKPNYVNRPIEKYLKYYVYPGSRNWLNGVQKIERELAALEHDANLERIASGNSNPITASATETILAAK